MSPATTPLESDNAMGATLHSESFFGYIATPIDAIKLILAANQGLIPRIKHRLSQEERSAIRSGSCFVFDEKSSNMKRWTDGYRWSKSRVDGHFLVYRMISGHPALSVSGSVAGDADDSLSPLSAGSGLKSPMSNFSDSEDVGIPSGPMSPPSSMTSSPALTRTLSSTSIMSNVSSVSESSANPSDLNSPSSRRSETPATGGGKFKRSLKVTLSGRSMDMYTPPTASRGSVKSLQQKVMSTKAASMNFPNIFCKKTFAINMKGNVTHVVCYYTKLDTFNGSLKSPSQIPMLESIPIPPEYLDPAHFRLHPKGSAAAIAPLEQQYTPPASPSIPEDMSYSTRSDFSTPSKLESLVMASAYTSRINGGIEKRSLRGRLSLTTDTPIQLMSAAGRRSPTSPSTEGSESPVLLTPAVASPGSISISSPIAGRRASSVFDDDDATAEAALALTQLASMAATQWSPAPQYV